MYMRILKSADRFRKIDLSIGNLVDVGITKGGIVRVSYAGSF